MYYACQLTRPHWIICSCLFLVQQSCSKHKHFKYPLLVSFFAGFLRFTLFLSSHFLPFAILILFFGFILFFSFILFFVWYLSLSHSVCPVCIYWFFFLFVCCLKLFPPSNRDSFTYAESKTYENVITQYFSGYRIDPYLFIYLVNLDNYVLFRHTMLTDLLLFSSRVMCRW